MKEERKPCLHAHVKWFYGQSERAYYLNYFIKILIVFCLVATVSVDAMLFQKLPELPLNCLSNHLTHDLVFTELALYDSPFLG